MTTGSRLPFIGRRFVLLAAMAASLAGASEPVSPPPGPADSTLAFADHLFVRRDYYRAITEYERFVFLYPADPRTASAQLRIAESYVLGGRTPAAVERLTLLSSNRTDSAVAEQASLLLAETWYRTGRFTSAIPLYQAYLSRHPAGKESEPVRLRLCLTYLQFNNLPWAEHEASRLEGAAGRDKIKDMEGIRALPAKSPVLAGSLSALLPGAGQLYDGNPSDAAISFSLNGLLIAGTVIAFEKRERVTGSLLSIVAFSFYTGNIYNAASGAHRANRSTREGFFRDLEIKWGLMPSGGDPARPALGLSARF